MISNAFSFIQPVVVIPPMVMDSPATLVSEVFDTQGYEAVDFLTTGGGWLSGASATILVEHGELSNGSDMTPVPDAFLYFVEADATVETENTVARVGYRCATGKRYVRVTVTADGVVSSLVPALPPIPQSAPFTTTVLPPDILLVGPPTPTRSETADTAGYALATYNLVIGASDGGPWDAEVVQYHSDNDYTSIVPENLVPAELLDDVSMSYDQDTEEVTLRIGYLASKAGAKRYIAFQINYTGTWSGSDGIALGAVMHLYKMPLLTSYEVLGLFRGVRTVPR